MGNLSHLRVPGIDSGLESMLEPVAWLDRDGHLLMPSDDCGHVATAVVSPDDAGCGAARHRSVTSFPGARPLYALDRRQLALITGTVEVSEAQRSVLEAAAALRRADWPYGRQVALEGLLNAIQELSKDGR